VAPAALGAGYIVFFGYSCLIGVIALILAIVIARKQKAQDTAAAAPAPA
jgi:PAT family beta-lactamase induction signal transducer AmpG